MIYCYNCKVEDHTSHENNYYIGRNSMLGNPFTYDGKKSNLAKLSFKTREECLDAYKMYFEKMYEENMIFKLYVDNIYEKYKNGKIKYESYSIIWKNIRW